MVDSLAHALAPLWEGLGWRPDGQQWEQFRLLQEQLRLWNGRLNLTRLVEGDDFWIAQVFDSLWPWVPHLNAATAAPPAPAAAASAPVRLIDVGTGGGFPGLALAIAWPAAQLTLVDSVARKLEAVEAMAEAVGLADRVRVRRERAERTGHASDCRGRFDGAMARAVASAPVVAEYLVPLLAPGGQAVLYRGQWSATDQADLERALGPLGARLGAVERCTLPAERGLRHAVWLEPVAPCPKAYPRAVGLPAKAPLGQPP
ncbi:MAG: 16S rRNA (guanine(527)-N(7))-methyltransferase RsmG [Cyanobacteriota bacterium]|nr:16S rRNA (guanine(527)-N(7))-methyltransferase RsmG [Cyanobacteriota bacterium]